MSNKVYLTYNTTVATSQGTIALWSSHNTGQPVLFLHGNSSCKESFSEQFQSDLGEKYRLVAMDLPGHGESDSAREPHKTYNIPGYAEVAMEVIRKLNLTNPIVVGSSLGGHIGLSMIAKGQKLAGLLITGTPPVPLNAEGFAQGFILSSRIHTLFSQPTFSETEAEEFLVDAGGFDKEKDRNIIQAAMRTDHQARPLLAASFQTGPLEDQRTLVETDETPLCVVQGSQDPVINNDYIQSLNYKNLFNKQVYLLPGDHGSFRKLPAEFNEILSLFIETITSN